MRPEYDLMVGDPDSTLPNNNNFGAENEDKNNELDDHSIVITERCIRDIG